MFSRVRRTTMTSPVRSCWNSKSRNHPDVACLRPVQNGDYCSFHVKNPKPFSKAIDLSVLTRKQQARLERFIAACKFKIGLKQSTRQGHAALCPDLATNPTELASMEPVLTIPKPFRFSFIEAKKLWLFDIRSLLQERKRVENNPFQNPYTFCPIVPNTLLKLQKQIEWLLSRRYTLQIGTNSLEQPYQQKIVELCFLIDTHGYLTNVAWFHFPSVSRICRFTDILDVLWTERLGLTNEMRRQIYPAWTHELCPLIRTHQLSSALNQLLTFLLTFVKAAPLKEHRALAAVYVLTALTYVSDSARKAFPWLREM
jgi:hypothetical protein